MNYCPKLAKRRKLEEDPEAPKCPNCKTPGHDEEDCYFCANMDNRPSKWNLTEAQKKLSNSTSKQKNQSDQKENDTNNPHLRI